VNHATAFDAAVDVLTTHAATGDPPLRRLLRPCELPSSRLPGRHDELHPGARARPEAEILKQPAARGPRVGGRIRNPLVVSAASLGGTPKEELERRLDQQHICHRVAFLLAAITARLLSWRLGTLAAPFGALVAKRGEAGGSTGVDGSWVGTTNAVASASATLRRFASSVTERVGASPSVRRVAWRTTNST